MKFEIILGLLDSEKIKSILDTVRKKLFTCDIPIRENTTDDILIVAYDNTILVGILLYNAKKQRIDTVCADNNKTRDELMKKAHNRFRAISTHMLESMLKKYDPLSYTNSQQHNKASFYAKKYTVRRALKLPEPALPLKETVYQTTGLSPTRKVKSSIFGRSRKTRKQKKYSAR